MRHVRLSCLSYIADSSRRELSFVRFWHSGVLPVDLSRRNSCPVRNFWRAFGFLMILGNNILNTTPQAFFRIFELLSFSLWTKRPPVLQQTKLFSEPIFLRQFLFKFFRFASKLRPRILSLDLLRLSHHRLQAGIQWYFQRCPMIYPIIFKNIHWYSAVFIRSFNHIFFFQSSPSSQSSFQIDPNSILFNLIPSCP